MSELQSLLSQKETLSEQLRRITEVCEGIENKTNAAKVATLNEEQLKLTAQKRELQTKTASIERELSDIGGKIQELSGSGIEKILNAIKNQRWFFFKNKPKVLLDRDTGLLWANLEYFPYVNNNNNSNYGLSEVSGLINSTNSNGIDGYTQWKIPTPFELWKMIEDKTFPYQEGDRWYIKGVYYWCVYYNGQYQKKYLGTSGATTDISVDRACVIPCSAEIKPADYENNIAPSNTVYTEKEKLQFTLNIFVTNELEPIFTDATITELYRQIYIVKPNLQKKLAELQQQIDALNEVELISPKLDWIALKKKFDAGADTSPIRYALSVKNLTEYLSMKFGEYVAEKATVLAELQKLPAAPNFIPDIKKLRADLNNFHADALKIYSSFIDAENLQGLYNLYKESYPPFSIVAETLTEKIRLVILRVEIFEVIPDFVRGICAEVTKKFNGNDKIKPYFDAVTEIYSNLFNYVLEGHLRQEIVKKAAAERVLEILNAYRKSIDNLKEDAEIARCGKICKNSLKEIEESLTDETEKRWLRINCIEKISG